VEEPRTCTVAHYFVAWPTPLQRLNRGGEVTFDCIYFLFSEREVLHHEAKSTHTITHVLTIAKTERFVLDALC